MSQRSTVLVGSLVFLAFLIPRVVGLGRSLNTDSAAYWFERTNRFWKGIASGDLVKTIPAPHPGVTLAWLSGASLRIAKAVGAIDRLPTEVEPQSKAAAAAAASLPTALVTSLFGLFLFFTFRRLTGSLLGGFLSVLFLAVDPWFLSQSRQFHLDALAISFSFLGLLIFPLEGSGRWRLRTFASAVLFALGALTRFSSLIAPLVLAIYLFFKRSSESIRQKIKRLLLAGGLAVAIILILWPVILVHPRATLVTLRRGVGWAVTDVDLPYTVGQPAWLEWTVDPLGLLARPALVVLVLAMALFFMRGWRRLSDAERLLAFVGLATFLPVWYAAKSLDRYLLPTIVSLDLLAGLALWRFWQTVRWRRALSVGIVMAVLALAIPLARYHPYEGLNRNTLFRALYPSLAGRSEAVLLGWGEGLPEAAAFLNRQSDAATIASWYDDATAAFFRGQTAPLHQLREAEYVVLYQNQIVRQYYPVLLKAIREEGQPPVYSASVGPYPLVWVYRTPERFRQGTASPRLARTVLPREETLALLNARGSVHEQLPK